MYTTKKYHPSKSMLGIALSEIQNKTTITGSPVMAVAKKIMIEYILMYISGSTKARNREV